MSSGKKEMYLALLHPLIVPDSNTRIRSMRGRHGPVGDSPWERLLRSRKQFQKNDSASYMDPSIPKELEQQFLHPPCTSSNTEIITIESSQPTGAVNPMDYRGVLIEVFPDRLYILTGDKRPKCIPNCQYFATESYLVYHPYNNDFGPLDLGKTVNFAKDLERVVNDPSKRDQRIIVFCEHDHQRMTNLVVLVALYQLMACSLGPLHAYLSSRQLRLAPYRDASYGPCSYDMTVADTINGFFKATTLDWFNYKTFNLQEYDALSLLENGDLNWIIPNKIVAFSTPNSSAPQSSTIFNGYHPTFYVNTLKELGVTTIIRLNDKLYDESHFEDEGFDFYDLHFPDGSCPPNSIIVKFLDIVKASVGSVALHCKAGLGRTGTLAGCYAISSYGFRARPFIGWIRLCRPGSILGPQQSFLNYFEKSIQSSSCSRKLYLGPAVNRKIPNVMVDDHERYMAEDVGQGDRLNASKKKNL